MKNKDDLNNNIVYLKKRSILEIIFCTFTIIFIGFLVYYSFVDIIMQIFPGFTLFNIKEFLFIITAIVVFVFSVTFILDESKQVEIIDGEKILYTSIFSKKSIDITTSVKLKYELYEEENYKNYSGSIILYDGDEVLFKIDCINVKDFITVAANYIHNITTDNATPIELTEQKPKPKEKLSPKELQKLYSWIDISEEAIKPRIIKSKENDIIVESSQLGKIVFDCESDFEIYIECEKFKFGKYTPEITKASDEFFEDEIELYVSTLNKIYEMRKEIITAILEYSLDLFYGEKDSNGNSITLEFLKENLIIGPISILSSDLEISFIVSTGFDDEYFDLLRGHSIEAFVRSSNNYKIDFNIVG